MPPKLLCQRWPSNATWKSMCYSMSSSCWFSFDTCYVYLLFVIWVLLRPKAHVFHWRKAVRWLHWSLSTKTTYFLYFWMNISQYGQIKVRKQNPKMYKNTTAFEIWINNATQASNIATVTPICIRGFKSLRCRLKIGNSENHSTANDSSPKTSTLVSSRDASNTDAKMAALVDREPGILRWC